MTFVDEHFASVVKRRFFQIISIGQYVLEATFLQVVFHFSVSVQMRLEIHGFAL